MAALCARGENVALIFADIRLPGLLDGVDLAKPGEGAVAARLDGGHVGLSGERLETLPDNVVYMPKPWLALDVLMQAERAAAGCSGAQRVS